MYVPAFIKRLSSAWQRFLHREDHYDFLPAYLELMERPPSPNARMTAITLSALVLVSLLWAYLGKLDMHASAEGRLVLSSRSQVIQPYELSEIVAIKVGDGQEVKAGDELLILNALGTAQDLRRCQEQLFFHQLERIRYQALLSENPLQPLIFPEGVDSITQRRTQKHLETAWKEYQSKLAELDAELVTNQSNCIGRQNEIKLLKELQENIGQRVVAFRKLVDSQSLGRLQLLQVEQEALSVKRELVQKCAELAVLETNTANILDRRNHYLAQQQSDWHDKLNRAITESLSMEQEIDKARHRSQLQVLRAPLDGVVQQLRVHTIGGVVQPAQELMVIAAHDAPQQAEIFILNKDVGFIRPGQRVTVKVESFPYSRYGTVDAQVVSISRDAVRQDDREQHGKATSVFTAQIALEKNFIVVEGKPVLLTPGMSIIGEIKVGKRRVIDYLFSPIREYQAEAWREP